MGTPPPAPAHPTEEAVRGALLGVIDPELGDNIVDLGMVRSVAVGEDGRVAVEIALTTAACPLRTQLRTDVETRVGSLPGVEVVEIDVGEMDAEERSALMARARLKARDRAVATDIPPTARVLGIVSGKGGVGKSSVTVNLAAALAGRGLTVGVLDADVWGFSVPRMLGMEGAIEAADRKMVPLERPIGEGLLKVVSMGFLASEDSAIMWRGLMLNRAVQHFLEDVHWGDLDYLLIDMPPGTGDVQMGLARMLPRAEVIIVTTPPLAAQKVAGRAADMARKGYLRVAGVIENMSAFECEHGGTYALFGEGGGARLAEEVGVPLIGSVPLDPGVSAAGDTGEPAVLSGEGPVAAAFKAIADRITTEIAPLVEMTSCTARLLERVEEALGGAGSPT
ncbi:MAG TPA: Mrp/NBP35 family ATP-binding protein [Acidimicrobiales bacterium]|nr:Mrp/NBP35 family ATP-binding protein [Acidimicrobiales bacterium]